MGHLGLAPASVLHPKSCSEETSDFPANRSSAHHFDNHMDSSFLDSSPFAQLQELLYSNRPFILATGSGKLGKVPLNKVYRIYRRRVSFI